MNTEDILLRVIHELTLYAACGFALFGLDDLLVDLIWTYRFLANRDDVVRDQLLEVQDDWRPAIFIPAWQEAEVIGATIRRLVTGWAGHDYVLFVGCYPNDRETQAEVGKCLSRKVRLVVLDHNGPTTKADCLNGLWRALERYEVAHQTSFDSVILHDAEDHVDPGELNIFGFYSGAFDFVQIPVIPIADPSSRWISGHYLDEFAEAHLKEMVVRQFIGASLPSAGTGTAISCKALAKISALRGGEPFDAESLTEDYELGLRLWQSGHQSAFVRCSNPDRRKRIAVRSRFPSSIRASVRQKTRWIIGIALAGWDRTGWRGGMAEHWMRWRDRRVILAATLIAAAYLAAILSGFSFCLGWRTEPGGDLVSLLAFCTLLFGWRLLVRIGCTTAQYGWAEGLRAGPRMLISNIIAVMAATRAVAGYISIIRTGTVKWDKTHHPIAATEN